MHIITHSCPNCGTIVSANILEGERVMNCPGLECDEVLSFEDLPEEEQAYLLEHIKASTV
jgi:hypothetical protein